MAELTTILDDPAGGDASAPTGGDLARALQGARMRLVYRPPRAGRLIRPAHGTHTSAAGPRAAVRRPTCRSPGQLHSGTVQSNACR